MPQRITWQRHLLPTQQQTSRTMTYSLGQGSLQIVTYKTKALRLMRDLKEYFSRLDCQRCIFDTIRKEKFAVLVLSATAQ